jgi:hypothetical protein
MLTYDQWSYATCIDHDLSTAHHATTLRNLRSIATESNDEIRAPIDDQGQDNEMASGINISDYQIQMWLNEVAQWEKEIVEKQEKVAQVRRKLAAIEELLGKSVDEQTSNIDDADHCNNTANIQSDDGLSLADAIPAVLKKLGKPMTSGQIKKHLRGAGYNKEVTSYFYTAVARCRDKNTISKTRNGRYTYSGAASNGVHHH